MVPRRIITPSFVALFLLSSGEAFHPSHNQVPSTKVTKVNNAYVKNYIYAVAAPTSTSTTTPFILQATSSKTDGIASKANSASAEDVQSTEKRGMTTLKFVGSASTSTDAVPSPSSSNDDAAKSLESFFAVDAHRDLLMVGTGNIVEPMDPTTEVTSELVERWAREAERVGAASPQIGDGMLRVTTQGIQFPGLKILSVATIGAKLVKNAEDNMPSYEFTLVKDSIRAEGPRPIRFIFNKLTASRDGEEKEQTTHSLTKTTAVPASTGDGLIFTSSSYLGVDVQFPSFLLRILPVSKEKAEEQGSASILSTIEKDSGPALENFKRAYLNFLG